MRDVVATERLLLRELEVDDLDALFEVLGDPVAMRYYPVPFDRDGVAAWIGVGSPELLGERVRVVGCHPALGWADPRRLWAHAPSRR